MGNLKSIEQTVNCEVALNKEKQLEKLLGNLKKVTVAFSGGTDSSYLLGKALQVLGSENVQAVTLKSALNLPQEVEEAASFALKLGARHRIINIDFTAVPEFKDNTSKRCYYCKSAFFSKIIQVSRAKGFPVVIDGSNADDINDHRPGMRAAEEMGIRSPLLEVSLGKEEIRCLSKQNEFSTWDKPSAACLASRIPYGEEVTLAKLQKVAAAEHFLRGLGLINDLRVRCHGNIARIEVNGCDLEVVITHRNKIDATLRRIGFTYVTLDLHGFESGSMNR